jgi:hypothetical protein
LISKRELINSPKCKEEMILVEVEFGSEVY